MATTEQHTWTIKPTNLFKIYNPDNLDVTSLSGELLLEVDNTGKPARSFRFEVYGENTLTVTDQADNLSSLPGCEAFAITLQFNPNEIFFRDNMFSGEWLDITDLVSRGRALVTIDDTDHTDEFLELVLQEKEKDHTKGGVIRWCANVSPAEDIELCLQVLPISLSGLAGRPAFVKDICPAMMVGKFQIKMQIEEDGPLRGPRPVLFAPDVEAARTAINHDSSRIKTGK